jgi:RimJ/RimL family protein N-acetyltransferase
MAIPRLETARLILREWQEGDFDAYARLCADPEVMRYLGGKTFSVLEAWRHMAYLVGHWALRGFGHWAVEEKATGQFVGRLGFQEPQGWPGFEVGWTLAKDRWGRGYATEGATTALDYAFSTMGRARVISLTLLLDSGVFSDQQLNECTQQRFPSLADVVHKLKEPQVQREFLLGYAPMWTQPTAQERPVTVDGQITLSTSAPKPRMRVSTHEAPQ